MNSHITPDDFYSDCPPERIIGIECEYNLQQGMFSPGKLIPISSYMTPEVIARAGLSIFNKSKFLDNGGGIYVDVGDHLEYDTPECLGPQEAAAADMAGTVIIRRIVEASELPHNGLYRLTGSNTNVNDIAKTSGYHENYLLPRSAADSYLINRLLPAYAASCIWGLSGMVGASYVFSQKVWGIAGTPITRLIDGRRMGHQKPMFIIPPIESDNDTIGHHAWARVERRYADAGLSPEVRFMQLATMSLVLRMIEHADKIGPKRLEQISLKNPVMAAHIFAANLALNETVLTRDDERVTAQDIQKKFIEMAKDLKSKIKLPDDEVRAIYLWENIVDRFGSSQPDQVEYGDLVKMLDVAARHVVLACKLGPGSITNINPQAVALNLIWDRLLPVGGAQIWWKKFPSESVPPKLIAEMLNGTRLPRTRAAIRIHQLKHNTDNIYSLNWARIHYNNNTAKVLDDFYATS